MTQNSIDLAKQIVTLLKDAPRQTQIAALHVARTLLSEAESEQIERGRKC